MLQENTPQLSTIVGPSLTALTDHTCANTNTDVSYCWGKNSNGQLGINNTDSPKLIPQDVAEPVGISFDEMGGGLFHTCGLTTGGLAYCWGNNNFGQLGTNNTTPYLRPRAVVMPPDKTFKMITAGNGVHTCALNPQGVAWCWGDNTTYQLGDGTNLQRIRPRPVKMPVGEPYFAHISAGYDHTCAVGTSGTAYCWGPNDVGQLGTNNVLPYARPRAVKMPVGVDFIRIAAGRDHTCALTSTGLIYCWGSNIYGQTGVNSLAYNEHLRPKPVRMPNGVLFTDLSAGDHHTCALGDNNRVYCWGYNVGGQIGNSTNGGGFDALKPTSVTMPGGVSFVSVTAKYFHSCALASTGQAYCWGVNTNGELGTNDQTNRNSPTAVVNGLF